MREALLHREQRLFNRFPIGVRNVSPHGIGACAKARHLPKGAASDGSEVGRVAKAIFQHCAQSGREELRQMADPGTDLIMPGGVDIHGATAKALNPLAPLDSEWMAAEFGKEPDGVGEETCVRMSGAAYLFPRHGMTGEKASLAWPSEQRLRALGYGDLDAAYVGDQLMRLKERSQLLQPFLDGEDRPAQKNDFTAGCCADRIGGDRINGAAIESDLRLRRVAVPTNDLTGELRDVQCQTG